MMLKKFESLGTVLNRGQIKMVVGGLELLTVDDGGGSAKCPLKCSDVGCSSVTNNCQCKYFGTTNEYCGEHQ